ncbi:MAG: penicillin-binding protein, partial [Clostridia bacterium]
VWEYPIPGDPNSSDPQTGTETGGNPGTDVPPIDQNGSDGSSPTVPSAPNGLSLSKSDQGFKLKWKANARQEQVMAYNIYYSIDPANGFQFLGTSAEPSFYHQTNEASGWYYVTAVNSYGESSPSNNVNTN